MAAESKRGKGLYRNAVSYFGGLVMLGGAGMILFLLLLEFSLKNPSPYLGIFTYMVFPGIFGAGVVAVLFGMRRESLRRRRIGTKEALPFPRLDLNDRRTRKWFAYILVGGSLLGILLTFVGYNAFLFTESVTFCGEVCHTVMEPEHVAYMASPHARVSCVDCHVGHGAEWYVKAKLSGLRQVLAVTFGTYETPIPVPIKNLRPARETCEECHWPEKFYGAQLMQNPHFRYDEQNSAEQVSLLIKTGGGMKRLGQNAGIHWHMILDNEVTFKAVDEGLQEIPWISVKSNGGNRRVYRATDTELSEGDIDGLKTHVMDCMDCHNRPTHNFHPPDIAVDKAMASGHIPSSLPWIKKVAVDTLTEEYPDKDSARRGIRERVESFYQDRYPDVTGKRDGEINNAVEALVAIYDRSVFPAMNVNWKTYASNIGHRNWPGCFRCHDGLHESDDGKVLSQECTVCHTMPQRGPLTALATEAPHSDLDWHRWELKGKHALMRCDRCHEAGYRPPLDCAECHGLDNDAPMMTDMACGDCHSEDQQVQPIEDCADCHDEVGGLHQEGEHPDADCIDCHKPHDWKTNRATCMDCHEDLENHEDRADPCVKCHDFRAKAPTDHDDTNPEEDNPVESAI